MKKKVYCKDCYYIRGEGYGSIECDYSITETNKYNGQAYYKAKGDISDNIKGECKNYKENETK